MSAGRPINDEDLSTIRALYESAIPVKILLSKADLLATSDLESALEYTARQVRSQLGVEISVCPVSTAASHAQLLDDWFDKEIAPLYQRHQELARESIRRKTGALREAAVTLLRTRLSRAEAGRAPRKDRLLALERELREAAGRIEISRRFCLDAADEIRVLTPRALDEAAKALLAGWTGAGHEIESGKVVMDAIARTAGLATRVYSHLHELARSLTEALQRTAEALDGDDAPGEEELVQPLREMPRLDPPPISLQLRRPWVLYPRTMARSGIRRKLRAVLEGPLSAAFTTHARLVEAWSRKALAELQARFDSSADVYRAQLARMVGLGALTTEEQQAIHEDLASLEADEATGGKSDGTATLEVATAHPAES